ncbi:unnamed protein product, partial [marine sediment metagenome]
MLYGGWPGLALLVISVILLNPERKGKSLLIGGVGCTLIVINLMIRPSLQTITLQSGFYVGLIFGLGLIGINIFAFISKEGDIARKEVKEAKVKEAKVKPVKIKPVKAKPVKRKPFVEVKPVEIKEEAVVGIDWENIEFIAERTIDYIKTMQLKSTELPFYEIISKTGIKREALETIVDELISKNEISARVRDFVIIFKPITKEKREEGLRKIKSSLQQKMSGIDELIKVNRFDEAITNLNEVIEGAESFQLKDFINNAKEKINQCKDLKIEKRQELEEQKVKEELQTQISE